jgi:serine protease AprX
MNKDGSFVLSTPLRLDSDERFTGKDVTIAFLDSGFFPHADLTEPYNRILAYQNMNATDGEVASLWQPDVASWHGMMTSVVAAGNGGLSNGFYRGIAPEANVVLVKLARTGRITEQNIQDGLEWILARREEFNIKIVNISAGGDFEQSYLHDSLSQTVEKCVAQGLTIVCAVGNAGHLPNHPVFPPASSPSAIVQPLTACRNRKLSRLRFGFRRRFCPTRRRRSKPNCSKFWTKRKTKNCIRLSKRIRRSNRNSTPRLTDRFTLFAKLSL